MSERLIVPSLSFDEITHKLTEFSDWLENIGVNFAKSRLPEYKKFFESIPPKDEFNPKDNEEHHKILDKIVFTLREVDELIWIYDGFKNSLPLGAVDRFQTICGGQLFGKDDKNTHARNSQFELKIASHFVRCHYNVDLSQEADIVACSQKDKFFIECKRLNSPQQVTKRIKEAADQLQTRTRKRLLQKDLGIAVFDVTRLAFPNLGMTWGISPEDCKFAIQSHLKSIVKTYDFEGPFKKNKNVVLIWVQIHAPIFYASTNQPGSRLSSIFLVQAPQAGYRAEAFERLKSVLEVGI